MTNRFSCQRALELIFAESQAHSGVEEEDVSEYKENLVINSEYSDSESEFEDGLNVSPLPTYAPQGAPNAAAAAAQEPVLAEPYLCIWDACDAVSSYAWNMHICTGKREKGAAEANQGTRVVLDMSQGLSGHNITCEKMFTSYNLGQWLEQSGKRGGAHT